MSCPSSGLNSDLIAIVGMGCRWPGGVRNPSQLWDLLKEKRDGWAEFSSDHINLDGFYHPNGQRPGSMYTKGGHVLSEDPRDFDHGFFGISATEARSLDPAQRKLLEVTYEAFESAGVPFDKFYGSKTGVFVGNFNNDHQIMQYRDPDYTQPYVVTGSGPTILSNRLSYIFNLQGPSLMVDTGCSASMYALHLAILSIRNGDCDQAIVAGGNLILGADGQVFTTKLGAISPTSRCHTFDASADGYSRADGFGALYLKKLDRAVADADPIRAVIRGSAYNANGKTSGISHPSAEGQEAVIQQAYKNAGHLNVNETGYFECHGTGTPVGDPIEVSAIGNVFAQGRSLEEPLLIGSVKPNLGHGEASSAMLQVMKGILAMEHGQIPATIGITKFNPAIDFKTSRTKVVTEMTPWPANLLRRVSINSFGYGGANAHCIIDHPSVVLLDYLWRGFPRHLTDCSSISELSDTETNSDFKDNDSDDQSSSDSKADDSCDEYGSYTPASSDSTPMDPKSTICSEPATATYDSNAKIRDTILLPISGHDRESLVANVASASALLRDFHGADALYTLGCRKSMLSKRAFIVGDFDKLRTDGFTMDDCSPMLSSRPSSSRLTRIGFVFTGQGAQWPQMGYKLFGEYAVFRETIRHLDHVLSQLQNKPNWTIEQALREPAESSQIHDPAFSQTLCTALQIGLVHVLQQWNISPSVTVGHSSGEIAAAYAAGQLLAKEAIAIAYCRGQTVSKNSRDGLMLAVGLGSDEVFTYLDGFESSVKVAAVNSPNSVTLSGDPAAIEQVAIEMTADGVFNRTLKTGGNAYHSHHMLDLSQDYQSSLTTALQDLRALESFRYHNYAVTEARWFSSVTPQTSADASSPAYWRRNLESPVLFSHAVRNVIGDDSNQQVQLLIEVGPHPALASPVKQIVAQIQSEQRPNLKIPYLASLRRDASDDVVNMLHLAGNLFLHNAPVDLVAVNASEQLRADGLHLLHGFTCIGQPQYNFTYSSKPVYFESRISKEYRTRKFPRHDLLGSILPGCSPSSPSWRNILRVKDLPWLAHHRLYPHAVVPAAAYIAMAVEAASQVYRRDGDASSITSFTLRNVQILAALNIEEDDFGVETMLSLENASAADSKNSETPWFKFNIHSLDYIGQHNNDNNGNGTWTHHCSGLIRLHTSKNLDSANLGRLVPDDQLRPHDITGWYEKLAELGISYEDTFQCLSELQAYRRSNTATATVDLQSTAGVVKGGESSYAVHPAAIDGCLQLGLIACHRGQIDDAKRAFVPTFIHEVHLSAESNSESMQSGARAVSKGVLVGSRNSRLDAQLYAEKDKLLLNISHMKCTAYNGGPRRSDDPIRHVRQPYWKPVLRLDVDSLNSQSLKLKDVFPPLPSIASRNLKALNRYTALTLAGIIADPLMVQAATTADAAFLAWLNGLATGQPAVEHALLQSMNDRSDAIAELELTLEDCSQVAMLKMLRQNLGRILAKEVTSPKLLLEQNLLSDARGMSSAVLEGASLQVQRVIELFAHKSPRMRILEVGAGRGAITLDIMKALHHGPAVKLFAEYVCTDAAAWNLAEAEATLHKCKQEHSATFSQLDISQDPLAQGFEAGSFDLVISSGGIGQHVEPATALKNISKLLKKSGKLVMLEITSPTLGFEFLTRTLSANWTSPQVCYDEKHWNQMLVESNFSEINFSVADSPAGTLATVMVASAADTTISSDLPSPETKDSELLSPPEKKDVYLVYRDYPTPLIRVVAKLLRSLNVDPICTALSLGCIPDDASVISFIDIENVTMANNCKPSFEAAKSLLLSSSNILWLAKGSSGSDPSQTPIMKSMLRCIAHENILINAAFIELDSNYFSFLQDAAAVIVAKSQELDQALPSDAIDRELVLHDGACYVERFLPDVERNQQFSYRNRFDQKFDEVALSECMPVKACYKQPGQSSSSSSSLPPLYFDVDSTFHEPLLDGWVEIKLSGIGLNMKDIAVAVGKYDWDYLSGEGAGVVTAVGANVTSLQVGDAVFGLIFANMGNYARWPASMLAKVPAGKTLLEAASMPLAYSTSLYSLSNLARIEEGEFVLIQSASGALGMAAITLAQHFGAEVFATAGSVEKRRYLVEQFGIPKSHVFSSTDPESIQAIKRATGSRGVDVILSTAVGDNMLESWRCIAPQGRFIELGRVNVLDAGTLPLDVFKRNASFSSFDMSLLCTQAPKTVARLMKDVVRLWAEGVIGPIPKVTTFDITQLNKAVSFFLERQYLGKIVLTLSDPNTKLLVSRAPEPVLLDPKATYLLVGALGGLGRSIATWMVERGARHLVFASRSGQNSPHASTIISELAALGAVAEIIKGDVLSASAMNDIVQAIPSHRPLKGVIHAAMVETDSLFHKITHTQLQTGLGPKVQGSINLHEATKHLALDFFLMTSSISGVLGPSTQAVYAAANAFQDEFARFRHSQGLAATALSIGLVREIGAVSETREFGDMLIRTATYELSETELLQLIEGGFSSSSSSVPFKANSLSGVNHSSSGAQLVVGLEPSRFASRVQTGQTSQLIWWNDARMQPLVQAVLDSSESRHDDTEAPASSSSIKSRVVAAQSVAEKTAIVHEAVVGEIARLVGGNAEDFDAEKPLSSYGVDSLIAVELRNWLIKTFNVHMTLLELLNKSLKLGYLVTVILGKLST